jgi:hypothetical protein
LPLWRNKQDGQRRYRRRAFGGLGSDVLRLFDNADFGSVDDGVVCRSVARSQVMS